MADLDTHSNVEWVKVSDCRIGAEYQRKVSEPMVKQIASNFDPYLLGLPSVVRRKDGTLWVTDGQHRILALLQMGWGDQKIQVEVQAGMDFSKEANTHVDRQTNRRATSPYDRFHGRLVAGNKPQVDIDKTLRKYGLVLTNRSGQGQDSPNRVTCATTLEKVYGQHGRNHLDEVLGIITDAWGSVYDAAQAPLIQATSGLLNEYDQMLERRKLVTVLKRQRPGEYVKRGHMGRELNRKNVATNIVTAMVADYNRHPGRKLPPPVDLTSLGGNRGKRLTTVQRTQVEELVKQGYTNRAIKERYEAASPRVLKAIREKYPTGRKRKYDRKAPRTTRKASSRKGR